jgi:hypothetical protein
MLGICISAIYFLKTFVDNANYFVYCQEHGYNSFMLKDYGTKYEYAITWMSFEYEGVIILAIVTFFVILGTVYYMYVSKTELIITDRRVYGKTAFGKRVDLPLDSISAVGTSMFKGIMVATSSGKIKFLCIKNRNDIHKELSALLINRQEKSAKETIITRDVSPSNADELKKFKELLEQGVITQEEFETKKKQILGL